MEIFREAEGKFDEDKAVLKPMFRSVLLAVRQEEKRVVLGDTCLSQGITPINMYRYVRRYFFR